jgi:DNA-binding transcriptional regulator YdaS (Cro superfamily)
MPRPSLLTPEMARNVEALVRGSGLSRRAVARLLGVSHTTVSEWLKSGNVKSSKVDEPARCCVPEHIVCCSVSPIPRRPPSIRPPSQRSRRTKFVLTDADRAYASDLMCKLGVDAAARYVRCSAYALMRGGLGLPVQRAHGLAIVRGLAAARNAEARSA